MWTCECGRKVPGTVEQCRCGKAKPVAVAVIEPAGSDLSGAADWVEAQSAAPAAAAEKPSALNYRGYWQLATLALVLGLFFGSRYFNQWRASRQARAALVEALSPTLGAEGAESLAARYHAPCFEETYQIGWGRRGAQSTSKFDAEKYGNCVVKKAKADR